MISKVAGRFTDVEGTFHLGDDPKQSKVEVTIKADSLTSAHADRDGHLKSPDFLDVAVYPTLDFVSNSVEGSDTKWQVSGGLTIKGVTNPVTLDVEYRGLAADPSGNTRGGVLGQSRDRPRGLGPVLERPLENGGVLVGPKVTIEIETQGLLQTD